MAGKKKPDDYLHRVGSITLKLTNQDKFYWPKEGITKGHLVEYYNRIAPFILPYLRDRPESLHRFPNGIGQPAFYQKDLDTSVIPGWVRTQKMYSESNQEYINYLICNDRATLIYMANLGCIEINPWNSRVKKPDHPDWLVMDLDPVQIAFEEVVRAAVQIRKVLDNWEIDCYCKTSGATGLHVYIPLNAKYTYEIVRNFGQLIAQQVHALLPDTTSIERSPKKRNRRVYLDYLQNSRGQTLASPYSVRPRPGATVSAPLQWEELNKRLDPNNFTMKNIFTRLDKLGDIWKPVLGKGADLGRALSKVE